MNEINGMILFLAGAGLSALLCVPIWLVHRHRRGKPSSLDERFNGIILHCILPSNQGTPIEEVMANLEDEDMTGFHLSEPENGGGSAS